MSELLVNGANSSLVSSITTADTIIVIQSAASFPNSGTFRILIDSEIMLVTAVSGNSLTVTRGIEGSTTNAHAANAGVVCIMTAAGIAAYVSQNAGGGSSGTLTTTAPLTGGGSMASNLTVAISAATDSTAGSMSAADKTKLDGLPSSAMVPANNLSDVASATSARSSLGLGSAALLASSSVLLSANNLSDLGNAAAARTNLGLGSAALLASSAVLQVSNNLSDVGNASTARTNLGLGSMATQAAGSVAIAGGTITGLGTPVSSSDAATKFYVDSSVQGQPPKPTAWLATAAALPANTYSNGTAGVGATLTGNSNGALTVDGVAVAAGELILVKNEVAAANNGLYAVTAAGSGGAVYVLTRSVDLDTAAQFSGAWLPVGNAGATNANSLWICNPSGTVTVGTTALPWTQMNATCDIIQGAGITISGNTISANVRTVAGRTGDVTLAFTDVSGTASNIQIPAPTTSALGGVKAAASATSHQWVSYVDTSGVQHFSQPAFSDLSGVAAPTQLPIPGVNAQTGTAYTLALTDESNQTRLTTLTNASAITLTVPTNASVPFPIGSIVPFSQDGTGQVTVSPAGGVTINPTATGSLVLLQQGSLCCLVKVGTDTWDLFGSLAS